MITTRRRRRQAMELLEELETAVTAVNAERDAEAAPAAPVDVDAERALAARLLGVPEDEIDEVRREAAGIVITTTTPGPPMVWVPEDRPDDNGRHGLMIYRGPVSNMTIMPVYAPPGRRAAAERRQAQEQARAAKAAEVEAEKAPKIDDPFLDRLKDELATTRQQMEDPATHSSMLGLLRDREAALKRLISEQTAAHVQALADSQPPGYDADDVRFFTAVVRWARRVIAGHSEVDVDRATYLAVQEHGRTIDLTNMAWNAQGELDAALQWFADRNLEPPATDDTPTPEAS